MAPRAGNPDTGRRLPVVGEVELQVPRLPPTARRGRRDDKFGGGLSSGHLLVEFRGVAFEFIFSIYHYYCYIIGVTRTSPVGVITLARSSNGAFVTPLVRCATCFVSWRFGESRLISLM